MFKEAVLIEYETYQTPNKHDKYKGSTKLKHSPW